ncbi:cytochrome P450 [Streptomyces sp. NPDC046931]|uniref:cytochrome P450 n=1 Tax=Streptomyces sp. NPDC046931 TaxID=3154806 RepID=UPI00340A2192
MHQKVDVLRSAPVAVGRCPVLGHLPRLAASRSRFFASLRDQGEVVQVFLGGWPAFVLTSPEAVHEGLTEKSRNLGKGLLFQTARPFMGNGIALSEGAFHRRQRRILQPGFHRDRMPAYAATMAALAEATAEGWRPGSVVRLDEEMRSLAAKVIIHALFSSSHDIPPDLAEMGERVPSYLHVLTKGMFLHTLLPAPVASLPTRGRRRFFAAAATLRGLAERAVHHARLHAGEGDLLSLMVGHADGATPAMTDEQARDELLTLLIAGAETTATTLSWALHVLSTDPRAQDRIGAEAHAVGIATEPCAATPYTDRFLTEVLRLYQPNWLMMRRTTRPTTIRSVPLPEGTELILSAAALHRDPAAFPDPLRFDPDRWLHRTERDLPRGAYIPFGAGNRKCIGDTFAWHEMRITLAAIMARWRLHPVPRHRVRAVEHVQIRPNALPLLVTRRSDR